MLKISVGETSCRRMLGRSVGKECWREVLWRSVAEKSVVEKCRREVL